MGSHEVSFAQLLGYWVANESGSDSHLQPGNSGSQPGNVRQLWLVFPWYELTFWELWRLRVGLFLREEVEHLTDQLFTGLAHLHRANVMHGDLSFTNLLMRGGPCGIELACKFNLVISDFGSASFVPATNRPPCTEQVMAPEVALRAPAGSLTTAIDVWAAGIFVASAMKGKMFPKCPEPLMCWGL